MSFVGAFVNEVGVFDVSAVHSSIVGSIW